jgi:tetratricopeptide (TPR) repeat protein
VSIARTNAFTVLLAAGVALLLWSWAKGNQEILVLPFAFWLAVTLWRRNRGTDGRSGESLKRSNRRFTVTATAASVVWLLVAVTFACRRADVGVSSDEVDRRMDIADQRYKEGDCQGALEILSSLVLPVRMPQQNARKHHNRGVILIRLGRHDEAVEALKLALRYDASNAEAAYLLAALASRSGQLDVASEMADRALSIDPGHRPALRLKTEILRASARSRE